MAASRIPGPIGTSGVPQNLDDGTMILALSPLPGSIGLSQPSARVPSHFGSMAFIPPEPVRRTEAPTVQVLRQGSRGPEVQKLQRLLNARLAPSPNLAVDGINGSLTHHAVLLYQKGVSIATDGVVGKQTWYYLLKGDKATDRQPPIRSPQPSTTASGAVPKSPVPTSAPTLKASTAQVAGILEWPLEGKFAEAFRRTAPKLSGSMRHEFEALLSPTSLEIMAGSLVVWAGSHAFGVGEVVDIVLLSGGVFFLGMAAFDVAGELGDFLVVTSTAAVTDDLDEAASHLARAIAIMGVAAFIALLAQVARGRGGGKGGTAEAPPKPVPENAAPQSKSTPKEPRAPTAPEAPTTVVSAIAQRRADNARLHNSAKFQEDMNKVGVSKEQVALMYAKEAPLGFKSREQYLQFEQELDVALKKDGLGDADVGMKGTATTFYSENPGKPMGHHWDADPANPGDFDLNLTSKKMVSQMYAAGIKPSEKYGVFKTRDVEAQNPELRRFAKKWSKELGRDVNVVGYPEPQARDATEFILRGKQ